MTSQELTIKEKTGGLIETFRSPDFLEKVRYGLPEGESEHAFVHALVTALMERQDLVNADRNSLYTAVFKCASMGLRPDGHEAVINVYNTKTKVDGKDVWIQKATLIPMIDGYAKRVAEYGWSLVADVVYENDQFDEGSTAEPLFHKRARLGTDRGKPIGAYALQTHPSLGFRQEIFTEAQIEEVRKTSKQPNGELWTKWWDRAWKKTLGKQVAKRLPLDPKDKERLRVVLDEDLNGSQTVDALYGKAPDPDAGASSQSRALPEEAAPTPAASSAATPDPEDDAPLNEPSDEELDGVEVVDEAQTELVVEDEERFPKGMFSGQTIIEVIQSGERGKRYVQWAIREWPAGPMRDALDAFATAHSEFVGD